MEAGADLRMTKLFGTFSPPVFSSAASSTWVRLFLCLRAIAFDQDTAREVTARLISYSNVGSSLPVRECFSRIERRGMGPGEAALEGEGGGMRRAIVVSGVFGLIVGAAAHRRFGSTLWKVQSELGDVSNTLRVNQAQFSLEPYTEDADEFRETIDMWANYFSEAANMARHAVAPRHWS